jgi:hypothetical protein
MSDQEILSKINYLKGMVNEIVKKIQKLKVELTKSAISLEDFRSQRESLEKDLREMLRKIASLKENIKLTLKVREVPKIEPEPQPQPQANIKEEPVFAVPEDFMYYFSTEFEDFLNKANIYLSGSIGDRFIEIGFIEFFFPPTTEKNKPFNVSGLLVQRGAAENIRVSITLTDISDYNKIFNPADEGLTIDLEPEKPKAVTFKINAQGTHIYSFRALLKEVDSRTITEINNIFFDFEVKALPFTEVQNTGDMFETKTGKYLVYSYLACEREEAELLKELQLNLQNLGVSNFEPLLKIIPATAKTRNLLEIGQEINENILFLINNFKYLSPELYDFKKIDDLENKLLEESENLFKFAPDGIILKPLEKMENALILSMLFRTFFKICKIGIRKLNLLKTISEIGKDYKLDISKYFHYINTIKTQKIGKIQ